MSNLKEEHRPHGTAMLVWFFFASLIVYYLLSWKFLTGIWKVG